MHHVHKVDGYMINAHGLKIYDQNVIEELQQFLGFVNKAQNKMSALQNLKP